jgi:hypothetical protein
MVRALSRIRDTLVEGVGDFVTSMTGLVASSWSWLPNGAYATENRRFRTASAHNGLLITGCPDAFERGTTCP